MKGNDTGDGVGRAVIFVDMAGHRERYGYRGRALPETLSLVLSWRFFSALRNRLGLRRTFVGLRELTESMLCAACAISGVPRQSDMMIFISGRQRDDPEDGASASEWFLTEKFRELRIDSERYSTDGLSGNRQENVESFLGQLKRKYPDEKAFVVHLVDAGYRILHVRSILESASTREGLSLTINVEPVSLRWSWRGFLEGYWFDAVFDRLLVSRRGAVRRDGSRVES